MMRPGRTLEAQKGVDLLMRGFSAGDEEEMDTDSEPMSIPWTPQEDDKMVNAITRFGEEWTFVAHELKTRTKEECEARWLEKLSEARLSRYPERNSFRAAIGLRRQGKKVILQPKSSHQQMEAAQREILQAEYMQRRKEYELERMNFHLDHKSEGVSKKRANSADFIAGKSVELFETDMTAITAPVAPGSRKAAMSTRDIGLPGKLKPFKSVETRHAPARSQTKNKIAIDDSVRLNLLIMVMGLQNAPEAVRGIRESHYIVKIYIGESRRYVCTKDVVKRPGLGIMWGDLLVLEDVSATTLLSIHVFVKHRLVKDEELGHTEITVGELARRPYRDLVLSDHFSRVVTSSGDQDLTLLKIGVDKSSLPESWPMPVNESYLSRGYDKHLMIITRGTRGDVQPFLALARGLANKFNWMITIVSELRYKDYIKKNGEGLERGCIRFRISGGDTQKRVDSRLSKWAINLKSGTMQHLMLAFSEREFFDSETACFYFAKTMKPDFLMFGFTMASIAMIISEALRIPLLGFILQPTCIPSSQYPPVVPLEEAVYMRLSEKAEKTDRAHSDFSSMKGIMENNPFTSQLNHMRARRGLKPMKRFKFNINLVKSWQSSTWTDLQHTEIPLICPINEFTFGGTPPDWGPKTVLTNYIFLRGSTVPPLAANHVAFIEDAKRKGRKLIVLAFSSMPVERLDILRIANKIISQCSKDVCIFALIGDHTNDPGHDSEVETLAKKHKIHKRLLVDKGAPFGRLFPLMDAIVAHGGLGTTGEAIMAGCPVIVTGVMLFDQRFWGSRCHDMGIGPFPVHISKFKGLCVELIDKALEDNGKWLRNAKLIGKKIEESMSDDPTGVDINARTVFEMAKDACMFSYERTIGSTRSSPSKTSTFRKNFIFLRPFGSHSSIKSNKSASSCTPDPDLNPKMASEDLEAV